MNVIRGRVEVKGTGLGVGGLLVVLFDIDPGTAPEGALASIGAPSSRRFGSVLTDRQGQFEFRLEFPEDKQPRLLLTVLAPEEPGVPMDQRVLFTSTDVRQIVGPVEEYLIRIPAEALKPAGIPVPVDRSVAREEPQVMLSKLRQAVEFRVAVADETRNIAGARVDTARKLAKATDAVVESRITEFSRQPAPAHSRRRNRTIPV